MGFKSYEQFYSKTNKFLLAEMMLGEASSPFCIQVAVLGKIKINKYARHDLNIPCALRVTSISTN